MSARPMQRLAATGFQRRNLMAIRFAVEHHAATCCDRPVSILLNPTDHVALGVEELWGLAVEPSPRVSVKRLIVNCVEDHARREQSLQDFIDDVLA